MVFFTCSHCGESLQKPKVAKHYQTICRHVTPNLTCVDCLKDFIGDEYVEHTKCLSELQRYSAKGSQDSRGTINKGEKKQTDWFYRVQHILNNRTLKQDERELLTVLAQCPNLPRKKAKFLNFLKSAYRAFYSRTQLVESVWKILDDERKVLIQPAVTSDGDQKKNLKRSVPESEESKEEAGGSSTKKSKKSAVNGVNKNKNDNLSVMKENDDTGEQGNGGEEEEPSKFDWTSCILKVITKKGNQISLRKLEKKVGKQYTKATKKSIDDKVIKKLHKKLKKISSVTIANDRVVLSAVNHL